MDSNQSIANYLKSFIGVAEKMNIDSIARLADNIESLIGTQRTLFVCGNGGSAALASHIGADLGKTILGKNPRATSDRLRIICLNDSIPLMTAWGNDEGYNYIFSEQLKNLGKKDDLLLVITGSGNSKNILEVINEAKIIGMSTFGLLGFDGGAARLVLDDHIIVSISDYGIVEDIHTLVSHSIAKYLKSKRDE